MSINPSTIQTGDNAAAGFGWSDGAELHKCGAGGVLNRFKAIRRGTMAELVRFVMELPEERQAEYEIEKDGDHTFGIGEIRTLARRPDYPRA